MLKKTITYVDYNGVEHTEDFYFNLSKAELAQMEASVDGGLSAKMDSIVKSQNAKEIIATFKELILNSYGVKSEDGKRFIKNQELRTEFEQTEAFSELFMELATNSDAAANFVNAIIPAQLDTK